VPQEQRGHPLITWFEQILRVVEPLLERRGERGLEICDVGQVVFERPGCEQLVVLRYDAVDHRSQTGVLAVERLAVASVSAGVLCLLAQERIGFFRDRRIGDSVARGADRIDHVLLEADDHQRDGVRQQPELWMGRVPSERDVAVEIELNPPNLQLRHSVPCLDQIVTIQMCSMCIHTEPSRM